MTDKVIDLAAHKEARCTEADAIMAKAMRLRYDLKQGISLPIPDKEADALIQAITEFLQAAERFPR